MDLFQPIANCAFVTDDLGDKHCFSYSTEVAVIHGKVYEELHSDDPKLEALMFSRTTNKHKRMFREFFGI